LEESSLLLMKKGALRGVSRERSQSTRQLNKAGTTQQRTSESDALP
jgi:hypothetical protein